MYSKSANIYYEGWSVENPIGEGASARVFKVRCGKLVAALKVFDPAIFREDSEAQERLSRQSALVGHDLPGLIQILEIKEALIDGHPAPAILMEFKEGKSLEKTEFRETLTLDEVRLIISSVASTACDLQKTKGIVHRDIKPANILFDRESGSVTLLDTGVIRPLEEVNEVSGYSFVGTRRYSPPEFICRTHGNEEECWESITFYQLGATLYEIAAKTRPYESIKVEAQVTIAIQNGPPDFSKITPLPRDMQSLIRLSLRRDWRQRLIGLNWGHFLGLMGDRKEPTLITQDEAFKIIVDYDNISIGRENVLSSTMGALVNVVREFVLGGGCAIYYTQEKNRATLSVGENASNIRPIMALIIHPGHDDLLVFEIGFLEDRASEFYVFECGDLDGLTMTLKQRAAEYL